MNQETPHLWCAYPDDLLAAELAQRCEALLNEAELLRIKAFRFDRLKREYLTTRTLVRTALSHSRSTAPEAWRFQANAYGKPALDPDCGRRFNLSNSQRLVVCLVGEAAEVGVDVEPFSRAKQILEVAPRVFSPRELAQLDALNGPEKLDRAVSLWTLKESYIKARGMGLSLPLEQISFLFGENAGIRLELDPALGDPADRWRFCLLDHADHRVALMVECASEPALQTWEVRPLLSVPEQLPPGHEAWFEGAATRPTRAEST
jgi:4'-phosphopantetheinyl transferase